ncbi:hypothetical protein [Reyranella soli]|uniref:Metallo-beta-lactamase domain-containing protein n=1 Tax=Reyranella soli TaxID=1230389 RepID=A0A512N4H0_9HYPH|nr:hypothetical protein [Reyranella soli]GEP53879.1 hypothetical protein RSO01_10450 [Reyranella soli]
MAKDRKTRFSPLGSEAMGGHHARQGFRFQDRWLSFQLLHWIKQDDFRGALNEGADDVDASWFRGKRRSAKAEPSDFNWEIHQLKATSVTPGLLAEVFDAFLRKEAAHPATWSRYHLVATRSMEKLHTLPMSIEQVRNVLSSYGVGSSFAATGIADLGQRLESLGVKVDPAFVVERVELDFDAGWLNQTKVFTEQFHLRLAGHGIPAEQLDKAAQALLALVSGDKSGKLITREEVLALLEQFKSKSAARKRLPAAKPVTTSPARPFVRPDADASILISVLAGGGSLLRLPNGRYGLIDCNWNAATQVAAYIEAFKVEAFEFVAITHWDYDRFSGLLSVMSAVKNTHKLFLPVIPVSKFTDIAGSSYQPPAISRFLKEIEGEQRRRYGIGEVVQTGARSTIWSSSARESSLRVETFAADLQDLETKRQAHQRHFGRNDLCSVFRVSVADHHFLITGDATIKRWNHLFTRLLGRDESFRADGFTLPRHGANNTLNKDILGRIADPSGFYAVVDPAPIYGLPRPQVLSLVREANGEILVADRTPVHLLLTPNGLFERRFALGRAGELRVVGPMRHF